MDWVVLQMPNGCRVAAYRCHGVTELHHALSRRRPTCTCTDWHCLITTYHNEESLPAVFGDKNGFPSSLRPHTVFNVFNCLLPHFGCFRWYGLATGLFWRGPRAVFVGGFRQFPTWQLALPKPITADIILLCRGQLETQEHGSSWGTQLHIIDSCVVAIFGLQDAPEMYEIPVGKKWRAQHASTSTFTLFFIDVGDVGPSRHVSI